MVFSKSEILCLLVLWSWLWEQICKNSSDMIRKAVFIFFLLLLITQFSSLSITFGGMCSWRRVAVARVFALEVRCRIMRLLVNSRVGKNRDTRRETPAGAGAACTAIEGLSCWPEVSRGAEANCIYRPVSFSLIHYSKPFTTMVSHFAAFNLCFNIIW